MEIIEKYILDNFREISPIDNDGKIFLMQNVSNNRIYIRKKLDKKMYEIYQKIKKINSIHFSKIKYLFCNEYNLIVIEEYVQGENLEQYIKNNGIFDDKMALKLFYDLCSAVELLHENGIIHRDISPKNIMITSDNIIKIVDFDISRVGNQHKSNDTVILGTVGYAAPEQFGFKETDERTDIYSLGAVLNYMLTGKLLNDEICTGKKASKIVKRCTDFSPQKRYKTVKQLRESIEKRESVNGSETAKKKLFINGWEIFIYVIWGIIFLGAQQDEFNFKTIYTFFGYFVFVIFPFWLFNNKFNWQNKVNFLKDKDKKFTSRFIVFLWVFFTIVYSIIYSKIVIFL